MEPYAQRPIQFGGIHAHGDWRLKRYRILYGETPFDDRRFEPGTALAFGALPLPAAADGRPGVGFLIAHQGRGADYLVLGWWDRENELPLRIWVRDAEEWRPAAGAESVCVWDLQVIWHERKAYVETMLCTPADRSVGAYLRRKLEVQPPAPAPDHVQ